MLLGYLLCLNQNGALISESSFFDKKTDLLINFIIQCILCRLTYETNYNFTKYKIVTVFQIKRGHLRSLVSQNDEV